MKILGLNCDHADSAACIISNDEIVCAIEEERLSRVKHHFGFPYKSIKFCLDTAKLKLSEIDIVSINSKPFSNMYARINYLFKNPISIGLAAQRFINLRKKTQKTILKKIGFKKKIDFVDHHEAHIMSSYAVSGYDDAVVLSVDGFGDFTSVAWGEVKNNNMKIEKRVLFPNSMGVFYSAVTQYLGFLNYGDEYKVMGMSCYGNSIYVEKLKKIIEINNDGSIKLDLKYFNHHKKNYFKEKDNSVVINQLFSNKIENLLGKKRLPNEKILQQHFDIACSLQKIYEEYILNLIKYLKAKYVHQKNICLSGGCINNSLANGKISNSNIFENVYICSSPGDSGGAIGAAIKSSKKNKFQFNGFSGSSFNNDEINQIIESKKEILKKNNIKYSFLDKDKIINKTVEQLESNKIIGWFCGRMEFGPRALGNRSIICNPGMQNARSILNEKIKLREKFRPFAGSVLEAKKNDWFECPKNEVSPFMSKVYPVLRDKKDSIPAIVHYDGTCRIQTVNEKNNGRYFDLINNFYKKTNIPILLNTSFNENEPIVNTPWEAIQCFLRTNMDCLVIENFYFYR